jgi:hypothetical protein
MPYVIQWVWPIPLFVATLFAPESELHHVDVWTRAEGTGPWWLVRKDRTDQAKKSLRKLARSDYMDEQTIDAHIALIAHTIELERAETEGGGWKDLFRGTNRRRTEIVSPALGHQTDNLAIAYADLDSGLCGVVGAVLLRTADLEFCNRIVGPFQLRRRTAAYRTVPMQSPDRWDGTRRRVRSKRSQLCYDLLRHRCCLALYVLAHSSVLLGREY